MRGIWGGPASRFVRAGLAMAVVVAVGGCSPDPPEPPGSPPAPPSTKVVPPKAPTSTPTTPPSPIHQTAARDCPTGYPVPLAVEAETADELPHLSQIVACADGQLLTTYLRNSSTIVWHLQTTNGIPAAVDVSEPTLTQTAFRGIYPDASLEPGSWRVVHAAPGVVRWYGDTTASGLYSKLLDLERKAVDLAVGQSPKVFVKGSRARALATCAASGWAIAAKMETVRDADSLAKQLEQSMGIARKGSSCFTALQQADADDLAAKRVKAPVLPVVVGEAEAVRVNRAVAPIEDALVVVSKTLVKGLRRV